MSSLRHPSHGHSLRLRDLGNESCMSCKLCGTQQGGSSYCCDGCSFRIHQECEEAGPMIASHPFHPQHPIRQVWTGPRNCHVCRHTVDAGIMYYCRRCPFDLCLICAASILPRKDGCHTEKLEYPGHPHPLVWIRAREQLAVPCLLCNLMIKGEAYCCSDCRLFLHMECSEFPREVRHPLHPQHPLIATFNHDGNIKCAACRTDCLSANSCQYKMSDRRCYLAYSCSECRFFLDLTCAVGMAHLEDKKVMDVVHEHELAYFCVKNGGSVPIECGVCCSLMVNECLGCLDCHFFSHMDCIRGPGVLPHPVHPEHPLGLVLDTHYKGKCMSCRSSLKSPFFYACPCNFGVHIECALQTVSYYEGGESAKIRNAWHDHALFLCHRENQSADSCDACGEMVKGMAYSCLVKSCNTLFHKSCALMMPEIDHPFHPNHPLILVTEAAEEGHLCDACHGYIKHFYYSCRICGFDLDIKCISRVPSQKHVLHQHKLAYFHSISSWDLQEQEDCDNWPSLKCYVCDKSCQDEVFRCISCNFNLHRACMELPQFVKSDKHLHEMQLWEFYIDDDSGEYYCDFCEKRRNPDVGVYGCTECKMDSKLVAHIECALSWPDVKKPDRNHVRTNVKQTIAYLEEKVGVAKARLLAVEEELGVARKELAILDKEDETCE